MTRTVALTRHRSPRLSPHPGTRTPRPPRILPQRRNVSRRPCGARPGTFRQYPQRPRNAFATRNVPAEASRFATRHDPQHCRYGGILGAHGRCGVSDKLPQTPMGGANLRTTWLCYCFMLTPTLTQVKGCRVNHCPFMAGLTGSTFLAHVGVNSGGSQSEAP